MDGTPKKYTKVNEQVLKDFAVTLADSPNLSEKEILAKFPEFDNDVNAIQSARDYWATVGDNPTIPKDISTKFPEFDFGGTNPDLKKKGSTVSPVGGGSSGLPKIKYDGKEYGYNPSTLQVFQADGTELKQVKHLGKTYDVKDYLTNVIGVKPKQVDNTEYDFKTGFADRQQGAISAAQAPDVQSDRLLKRNKKFPSIKNNPQVAAAFDAYDNLKNAAAKTADKQNEYDRFLKTGTFTDESGQDIRPLGAIPTDVLGTTTVVEGSPAAEIKKKLENDLKVAKEDENKAYDDLGNKENTFRNAKLPELPVKKELGADKYEYEMPSQVNVLNFMQGLSNLEDHASGQGLSLKQYSDSVENIAADAFLSPDQQNLFKELNSGDERAARSAIARYDENIDKQINAINKQLALGATPAQKAYLINERTRLTDQKSDFFSPRKAIEAVGTLNPQLKPVFDAFAGIGDQDKASLVYAKVFKDSQDLADELIGQPLFIDQDGKQVINPKVTDYLVGGQDSPFRRKSADKRELLQKNINTLELLAPATLLNRRPLEKKGSFIESFGKTIAKGIGFDTGFTQTMVETDKPSVIANFLADATVSTKDLPTNQAKQLEQIGKQSNWEFAGSTLGYLIPAGVQLAVGGAELAAMKFITSALKRTSTAADLAYDIIKLTKGSSMLNKAVKMGADAQLGGWTFSDPEMGFANIGAESLAGELFEKAIKKLPGGALVTKVAKKVFADNYITALNKIGKMNAYGLGETTGEFAGSLVQLYQDSDTWNDFYDKFQQQFGKAEENLKFFLSCHSLGMVMGNHAAPATKAVQNAADKAYQKLTPDEKKIADEVIENDVDATNVATVDVLRNNVQVVPDADLKTRIEQVKKAKADLDALPDLKANTQNAGSPYIVPSKQGEVKNAKDGAYEIKVGDITLSGNTPEQLANDKDLINSLDLIYSGEQQRREAEGITVETPPIETGEVNPQATGAEAGVGVEGEVEKPTPSKINVLGQEVNSYSNYVPTKAADVEPTAIYTFSATSKDGIPPLLQDKAYANKGETSGVKTENWHASISGDDLLKLFPTEQAAPSQIKSANAPETAQPDVAGIERRRKQLRGKALEAIGVDERQVDGSKYEAHSKAKDYSFDRAITLAENQITANPISKLGALPMDAANAIKAELHIAGVKATDKTPLSEINDKLKEIKAKYDAELAALETTEILPQEGVTEPTKAPVIKAQVVGTTAGLNTIIDGGLGKQQDPRFTGEVQQGKSIFKVNPNNNESSFLDISLPSSDSFGRSGGVQIRFELPNGVDANTVFEAVKKEAAKLGRLDAKDPDFKSKVQGLVDKGIAEIQGLATGGAKQAAQVKETVSEKQVSEPLKDVNSTAEAIGKLKVSDLPQNLIDTYVKGYSNGNRRIAEAYHKAKADGSNPDLVQAVEELLAPKGEVKAEPSVKAEVKLNEGDKVGVRLNLNIRKTTGENVLSVHDRSFRGKVLGHSKAITLRNVKFSVNENAAEKIASGESDKFPMASVDGEYVKTDKHNTDGVEIYFNPKVSKYFVDSEGNPVASAKEVSVVGNMIYATDIKYKNEELTSLPLSILNKIPKGRLHISAESQQKLKEDISKNGIQEPLVLIYSVKDNALRLKEGHHRLDAANSLGLTNVPVKVQVEWNKSIKDDSDIQNQKMYYPPSPLDVEGYKKRNYQPTNIKLTELGFKTPTEKVETEPTADIDNVADKAGIAPKNLRDLYNINRTLFGLNKVKSLAAAVAMDRMVGVMAKRAGITKAEMYGRLEFKKDTEANVLKADNALFQGTVNGENVTLRNTDVDVVNGFYSPLRKIIAEAKQDKMPAKQWIEKFARGEEAKWTGLTDWLAAQQGSVSKADILDYLKNNRISIVEVVKGDIDYEAKNKNLSYIEAPYMFILKDKGNAVGYVITFKNQDKFGNTEYDVVGKGGIIGTRQTLEEAKELLEAEYNASIGNPQIDHDAKPIFSEYQLEGDKSNYKEVLVTLPKKKIKVDGFEISETDTVIYEDRGMSKPLKIVKVIPKKFTDASEDASKYIRDNSYNYEYNLDYNDGEAVIDALEKAGVKFDKTNFKSSHFDEPNILVHLRMNTRTDAEGNKVLFLEEVQSDWGQEGKRKGFGKGEKITNVYASEKVNRVYEIRENNLSVIDTIVADSKEEALSKYLQNPKTREGAVPAAPFVTDTNAWVKLGLKVALKEAVAQGADKIAWTTGEQQNDRYDLSKQVDKIDVEAVADVDNLFFVDISLSNGTTENLEVENGIIREGNYKGQRLDSVIGKDYADKIMSTPKGESVTLQGADLKVGGKGMKGFYGSPTEGSLGIVGNVAKGLFKQDVGLVKIPQGKGIVGKPTVEQLTKAKALAKQANDTDAVNFLQEQIDRLNKGQEESFGLYNPNVSASEYFDKVREPSIFTQNSITITPDLRTQVQNGLALFQKQQGQNAKGAMVAADGGFVIYALTDPNVSTPLHEVAHVFEHYLTDSERAAVNNWAKTGAWTTETSEKFARGFEKYLSEGIAPTEGLKKVFEKFKTWLTDIYNGIKGSDIDIELNDDMRSIYAKMLGEDAVPTKKTKAAPKKAKKAAIQSDVIDKLVGNAANRREAYKEIADENIKEVAKIITDTNGKFDKVMDAIDNNDQLLADLEKKLGIKKICKVF